MEPTQALYTLETALRVVVREVLGERWLSAAGARVEKDLEKSRERDKKRRDGVVVSNDLLDFTETRELTGLIRENWASFEPVFKNQTRTMGFLQVLEDERFSVAHSRDLVPFEQELLSGIAGQLRQQIALWRNDKDPSSRFYPLIEEVKDNYGNTGGKSPHASLFGEKANPRLEVGEVLTLTASAFGEQKRPVRWYVSTERFDRMAYGRPHEDPLAEGDQVTLEYAVTDDDISEDFTLNVYIDTASRHHRSGSYLHYDDVRYFFYAVNPPEDE